ncbi:MAG: PAS domain-containing protein [Muribaculaceae bacterium]|nr:PAS domain-containing protein [Muribaculaceae bacterium]
MNTNDCCPVVLPDWAMGMNCAVTVCDADGTIIYMNERSRETFAARGGAALIGRSLIPYHNERSQSIIRHMLATGESNCYTIEKHGVRKMIYQTPWRDVSGAVAGLVEISMVIPEEMPHYVRD